MGISPPGDLSAVPVFPLPGVVLLPTAILPLHIFEQRYREMTRIVLAGNQQIAMALLADGWQQDYYGRPAIEPVVCVGQVISCEQLRDGKYNLLLQGHGRARVVRELQSEEPFRRFELEALEETPVAESELLGFRQQFAEIFQAGFLAGTAVSHTFGKLLIGTMLTRDIADLIAFTCFDEVAIKQNLLSDPDVRRRVRMTAEYLKSLQPPAPWPSPTSYNNPSAN